LFDAESSPAAGRRTHRRCRGRRRSRQRKRLVLLALIVLPTALGPACSIEEHYELLSFFFDGVPNPNAPIVSPGAPGGVRVPGAVYYTHQPYAEEACAECHGTTRRLMLTRVEPTVCLNCHPGVPVQYPHMHGPVVANACLWCHAPHESTIQPLLQAPAPELCLQCHGLEMMTVPQPPEHDDLQRDCLECHRAHGGEDLFFLTNEPAAEEPGSEPSEPADAGAS
jgi:predicted CXXCH cytochrome family protein